VLRVEFGGKASESVASADDPRPGHEVYHNRVTQLWWQVKEAVCGGQIRGMCIDAARQFCSRQYKLINRRYNLAPKEDCLIHAGESPDDADAIAVLVETAQTQGMVPGGSEVNNTDDNVLANMIKLDEANADDEIRSSIGLMGFLSMKT
jgi:hypothetical protein